MSKEKKTATENNNNEIHNTDDKQTSREKIFPILHKKETKVVVNIQENESKDNILWLETNFISIHNDIIKFFINSTTKYQQASLLHQLCSEPRNVLPLKSLINTGIININVIDKNKKTPLHVAVIENCIEIVELLLDIPGIKVNKRDHVGKTPLHYSLNNRVMLELLLQHKEVNVMHQDLLGKTILHYYCFHKTPLRDIVELILKKSGNEKSMLSLRDEDGNLPKDLAHNRQHSFLMPLLDNTGNILEVGHPVRQLYVAVDNGNPDEVEKILVKNISYHEFKEQIHAVLHASLLRNTKKKPNYLKIIKKMLAFFPQLCSEKVSRHGKTPLHIASESNLHEVVATILENAKVDVHTKCEKGRTALQYAIKSDSLKAFKLLLGKIKGTYKDDENQNILHYCFQYGGKKKLSMFSVISEKADYEPRLLIEMDNHNMSPLHYLKEKKDWLFLCHVGKCLLKQPLTIEQFGRKDFTKLANKLDSKYHSKSEPLWMKLCVALKDKNHLEISQTEIHCISKECNYALGKNIIEVLKIHGNSVDDVILAAEKTEHVLIAELLKDFSGKKINELCDKVLRELAIHVGSASYVSLKNGLYDELNFSEECIDSIENRHSQNCNLSPSEDFLKILKTSKPKFEIRILLKLLQNLEIRNVANILGEIAFEIILKLSK